MSNGTRTRRSVLAALGTAATGAVSVGALPSRGSGTHEPGTDPEAESDSGPRWRTRIGGEPDRAVVAGDGVVYAASTSDEDSVVGAYEPDTGELRWEVDDYVVGRSVANDDYCFYTHSNSISALDPADGSVAWRDHFPGFVQTGLRLHDGTLYVGWGSDGRLSAYDPTDGSELWSTADGGCEGRVPIGSTTPVVAGGTLFAEVEGGLCGYNTADGQKRYDIDQRVYALASGRDVATVSWRGTVRAVTPDGDVRWTRELPRNVTGLQTVGDAAAAGVATGSDGSAGVVVARTAGDPAGHYEALSLADGSTVWEFTADAGPISMPVTANGTAYAAVGSGRVHAFDPATGDVQASYEAVHGLHGRPAVAERTVAVPCDEGFLYGFETRT